MATVSLQHFDSYRLRTETAIGEVWNFAVEGSRDLGIIDLATDIIRSCPEYDQWAQAQQLFRWYRKHIYNVYDPFKTEMVQHPRRTLLERRAGDCDDATGALLALGMAVGIAGYMITIAGPVHPIEKGDFSHIYPVWHLKGRGRTPADPVGGAYLGWEPPKEKVIYAKSWYGDVP